MAVQNRPAKRVVKQSVVKTNETQAKVQKWAKLNRSKKNRAEVKHEKQ